ncbi:MAG: DUF229 domain-containing protein [Planctomycetota bacterium]|nr:MAG: DUF229 domain-containing protein [Planctomycetota bacterium]
MPLQSAFACLTLFFLLVCSVTGRVASAERPNILWFIVDDMSANFGCYGETAIATPAVDALAQRGMKFTRAFVTAPVCSTCRSAFITGMYQTSIGAHHHRSGRGEVKLRLPAGVRPIPELFQDAGYYTTCSGWPVREDRLGKTDYNFEWDPSMYDGADWGYRQPGQPFFAQIHVPGGKLRGASLDQYEKIARQAESLFGARTPDALVRLPPYYPPHPVIVRDWAAYLDSVRITDHVFGQVIARLEQDGELDNTLVVFMTDHGISHARGKQFLYDEGIHVPLVVAGPGIAPGTVREDLVEHIDIAALSLAAAGIPVPDWMQARDILAEDYRPREAVFAARDRCDETVDHIRCVRTQRYKYIRNYLPHRPLLQPNAYKDHKAILQALREAGRNNQLDAVQAQLLAPQRPPEELYDLAEDPHEIHNLAQSPEHAKTLESMRKLLTQWEASSGDRGRQPEPWVVYDSDMRVYLDALQRRNPDRLQEVQQNIALMKQWAMEGK